VPSTSLPDLSGSLDDVGQGYDLAQLEDRRVAFTLGRHTNDHTTSFYVNTPSGFFVEYGWGGRVIEPGTWQPQETFDGPSLWGATVCTCPSRGASACETCGSMPLRAAFGLRIPGCRPSIARGWTRSSRVSERACEVPPISVRASGVRSAIETEIMIDALEQGPPVREIEAPCRELGEDSASKLPTMRDGVRILRLMRHQGPLAL